MNDTTTARAVPGPYDGVTVVEFGQFIAVPYAGQLLADGGARVIKVEPIGGDAYRRLGDETPGADRAFHNKNRAKESIAIDLANPRSADVIDRLIRDADVILINMSPAAVARRGLDYERVAAINPRAVYGIVTAYGTSGDYARLPGMDIVVQAWSGLLDALGAVTPDGLPRASEVPAIDHTTALLLLNGVTAALLARERTGRGQRVDVSLLAGALTLQNKELIHLYDVDDWRHEFVRDVLPALRAEGAGPSEIAAARKAMRPDVAGEKAQFHAHFRIFRTGDGFVALGAGSGPARKRLFESLGIDEGLLEVDPAAATEAIAAALARQSTEHWVASLGAAGVPIGPVRNIEEMLFDPHVEEEGFMVDFEDERSGRFRAMGSPIFLSDTPWVGTKPAPQYARHTTGVLTDLGFSAEEIDELIAGRAVEQGTLSGVGKGGI